MKGLLLKDFLIFRNHFIVTAVSIFLLTIGLGSVMESAVMLMLTPTLFTEAVFECINADSNSKWNRLAVTMPVSRRGIIAGKYLLFAAFAAAWVITGLVPSVLAGLIKNDVTFNSIATYRLLGTTVIFFSGSVSIACAFLFNTSGYALLIYMLSIVAGSGIFALLLILLNLILPVSDNTFTAFGIELVLSVAAYIASFIFTTNAYEKKDIA